MSFLDNSQAMEVTGKIMAITIIILFVVVLFFLFLHLYAKWYVWNTELPPQRRHNRRRFVFNSDQDPVVQNGLEISVLRSIPVLTYDSKEFKDGLECAVCLCQVVRGEKARVLPKCSHGFHVDCIDMWFQSHSTCPLCRSLVSVDCETQQSGGSSPEILGSGQVMEFLNFPTNVLFWGDQGQITSAENGRGLLEEGTSSCPSSSSSRRGQDEMRIIDVLENENGDEEECTSPEPTPTKLRSLKRLWSREKRLSPGTCSGHVEV